MAELFKTTSGEFFLVRAASLRETVDCVPSAPGVYFWLVRGGHTILELTSYYQTDRRPPLRHMGLDLMYVGASHDLQFRIGQHVRNDNPENSSPRKTLYALEHIFGAVSSSVPSAHKISEGGLTEWIYENVTFGFAVDTQPYRREHALIRDFRSPFNIAHRRRHRYSKYLMAWRATVFPSEWMTHIPFQRGDESVGLPATIARKRLLRVAVAVK